MEVDVFHLEWSMFDERSRAHQTTTRIITTSFSFFWTTRRFFSSFFFCVYYQRELVSCLSILLLFLFLPLLLWSWRRLVVITSRTLQRPIKKKKHFWTPTVSDIMLIIKTENKNKAFRRDFYNTNGEREKTKPKNKSMTRLSNERKGNRVLLQRKVSENIHINTLMQYWARGMIDDKCIAKRRKTTRSSMNIQWKKPTNQQHNYTIADRRFSFSVSYRW